MKFLFLAIMIIGAAIGYGAKALMARFAPEKATEKNIVYLKTVGLVILIIGFFLLIYLG